MQNRLETPSNESEKIPEKLYRAFTVSASDLKPDLFDKPLTPGLGVDERNSIMKDGNELGVYMTTNETMANTAYAHSKDILECPRFNGGYGLVNFLELPRCGITVEVHTAGLKVRQPQISPQLMGHYNNGFQGDEWIADEIPASKYRVRRLTLSTHSNDTSRVIREVTGDDDLIVAIQEMRTIYNEKLSTAKEFAEFLNTLDENIRFNEYRLRKAWEKHQKDKVPDNVERKSI